MRAVVHVLNSAGGPGAARGTGWATVVLLALAAAAVVALAITPPGAG